MSGWQRHCKELGKKKARGSASHCEVNRKMQLEHELDCWVPSRHVMARFPRHKRHMYVAKDLDYDPKYHTGCRRYSHNWENYYDKDYSPEDDIDGPWE